MKLMVGDKLYASCSGEIYGDIVESHDRHCSILIHNIRDAIDFEGESLSSDEKIDESDRAWYEWRFRGDGCKVCPDVDPIPITVRGIYYEFKDGDSLVSDWKFATGEEDWNHVGYVTARTPGYGCHRCTKYFSVLRKTISNAAGVVE